MSRVGSTTRSGARSGVSSSAIRMRTASTPICRIGCSTVVSGGVVSADSGTLSKPMTESRRGSRARGQSPRESPRAPSRRWPRRSPSAVPRAPAARSSPRAPSRAGSRLPGRAAGRRRRPPARARAGMRPPGAAPTRGRLARRRTRCADDRARQVLDGGDGAEKVLGVDGRQCRRADVVVDRDHRRAGRRIDAARRDEDDAVRERAADPREVAALPAGLVGLLPAAREDDELVARAVDPLGDSLEELGAERLDVADEHADHLRPPAPQALTGEARVIPELVDHARNAPRSSRPRRSAR